MLKRLYTHRGKLALLGMVVAGVAIFQLFSIAAKELRLANQAVLNQPALGQDPFSQFFKCLYMDTVCSTWYYDQLQGKGSAWPLATLMVGLIPILYWASTRKKQAVYSGSFAKLEELSEIRHSDIFSKAIGTSIIVGHHHPLPIEEPSRSLILRGKHLPDLDSAVLAVAMGYGKRRELGHYVGFGTTRSGKSLHHTANVALWRGSYFGLDPKGDLYNDTAGLRATYGKVFFLSPSGEGHRFDAISSIMKAPNGALIAGRIITNPESSQRPEFALRAAAGLAAIFEAAVLLERSPLELAREVVLEGGIKGFWHLVASVPDERVMLEVNSFLGLSAGAVDRELDLTPDPVYSGINEVTPENLARLIKLSNDDKFLVSSWGIMTTELRPFISKEVLWTFSGNDFDPAQIVRKPTSIYLGFPEATLGTTGPIYNLIITAMVTAVQQYVDQKRRTLGNRWYPPVPGLMGLDEAARAPVKDLADILSTAAGRGLSALIYLQSPSQFDELYGPSASESILNNCSVQTYFKTESLKTAKYLQERCHQVSVATGSTSRAINRWFPTITRSKTTTAREVLTVEEAFALGGADRQMTISFVSGQRPILNHRFEWFHSKLAPLLEAHPAPSIPAMGEVSALDPVTEPAQPKAKQQFRLDDFGKE